MRDLFKGRRVIAIPITGVSRAELSIALNRSVVWDSVWITRVQKSRLVDLRVMALQTDIACR